MADKKKKRNPLDNLMEQLEKYEEAVKQKI